MMRSGAAEAIRREFVTNNYQCIFPGDAEGYGHFEALWDSIIKRFFTDPGFPISDSTPMQVGGLGGYTVINNGDGTATFIVVNERGAESFFNIANIPWDYTWNKLGADLHIGNAWWQTGPGSTITQVFEPHRLCWRLQLLRGWSHDNIKEVSS
jgi:hypothetical protein